MNEIAMGKAGNPNWLPGVSANPGGRSRELAQQQSAARLKAAGHSGEVVDYLLKNRHWFSQCSIQTDIFGYCAVCRLQVLKSLGWLMFWHGYRRRSRARLLQLDDNAQVQGRDVYLARSSSGIVHSRRKASSRCRLTLMDSRQSLFSYMDT